MSVYRVFRQKEVAVREDDANSTDTIPTQHSERQTAHEGVEKTRVRSRAELVPEDDYAQAEGPWHWADADGQARLQAHQSIQHGLSE